MKKATASFPTDSGELRPHRRRSSRVRTGLWSASLLTILVLSAVGFHPASVISGALAVEAGPACATYGSWVDPKRGRAIDRGAVFQDLAARSSIVLLGESHTAAEHHRWQLQTLAALHGQGRDLVIGFEAFPRRLQSVLDDWVDGKLSEDAFLKASEWRQVWGYDSALYMPLFQFAQLNRIPMIALNVERRLVGRVGQEGWNSVPQSEREGLSDPAPASRAYQLELARIYLMKKTMSAQPLAALSSSAARPPERSESELADAMNDPEFKRFVEAQLTWDRAMAEALAGAHVKFPNAIIAGVLGSGHVEGGHGVPHQLKDIGTSATTSLMPVGVDEACELIGTSFADLIFTLPQSKKAEAPEPPRLGVFLAQGDRAPRINQVAGGSVAEAAGLQAGDHVVRAAGLDTKTPDDLVEIVGRQAPGTWLPLSIRRGAQDTDLIAKFPPRQR